MIVFHILFCIGNEFLSSFSALFTCEVNSTLLTIDKTRPVNIGIDTFSMGSARSVWSTASQSTSTTSWSFFVALVLSAVKKVTFFVSEKDKKYLRLNFLSLKYVEWIDLKIKRSWCNAEMWGKYWTDWACVEDARSYRSNVYKYSVTKMLFFVHTICIDISCGDRSLNFFCSSYFKDLLWRSMLHIWLNESTM